MDLGAIETGSIQAIYTGAPTGSLYLELSDQIIGPSADPNTAVTQWSVYSSSAQAISAAGDFLFNISNMGYKWLRLTYVPSGGTGSLNATANVKGTNV